MDGRSKEIIEGFDQDFDEIVANFTQSCPDVKLKAFLSYWTDNHLDCIFANRFDPRELFEAIAKINSKLVKLIIDNVEKDDNSSLIALYFLLCLFIKQPKRSAQKIRLTCDDLISMHRYVDKFPDEVGASFVLKHLKTSGAIDLVEERTIYGPSMLTNRGAGLDLETSVTKESSSHKPNDALNFIESKIEPMLGEISRACSSYEQLRNNLQLDDYKDPTVELHTVGSAKEFIFEALELTRTFKTNIEQ